MLLCPYLWHCADMFPAARSTAPLSTATSPGSTWCRSACLPALCQIPLVSVCPQLTPDQCVTVAPELSLAAVLFVCAKKNKKKKTRQAKKCAQIHRLSQKAPCGSRHISIVSLRADSERSTRSGSAWSYSPLTDRLCRDASAAFHVSTTSPIADSNSATSPSVSRLFLGAEPAADPFEM